MRKCNASPWATAVPLGLPCDLRHTHWAVRLGFSAQQNAALSVFTFRAYLSCCCTHCAMVCASRGVLMARACAIVRLSYGTASVSRKTAWAVASACSWLTGNGGRSSGLELCIALICSSPVSGCSLSDSSVSDPPSFSNCSPFQTSDNDCAMLLGPS